MKELLNKWFGLGKLKTKNVTLIDLLKIVLCKGEVRKKTKQRFNDERTLHKHTEKKTKSRLQLFCS